MKVLDQPHLIRAAISELLSDPTDERIIAVGFVGDDASSHLRNAAGIQVFCWPKAGGTNPHGVQDLLDAGCSVSFVDRLHAKVYWSLRRGSIVGSANLSSNALGESGLREYMIFLPAGIIDLREFARTLRPLNDFDARLRQLHRDHNRLQRCFPTRKSALVGTKRTRTFGEWLQNGAGAAEWRLGWYEGDAVAPKDAVNAFAEETGNPLHARFLGVKRRDDLGDGIATLGVRVRELRSGRSRLSAFDWWLPEFHYKTTSTGWKEYPYIWFAKRLPFSGYRPPFDIREKRFRIALTAALNDRGTKAIPVRPHLRFLKTLERCYGKA
jgi:hypothetical protein